MAEIEPLKPATPSRPLRPVDKDERRSPAEERRKPRPQRRDGEGDGDTPQVDEYA